LAHRPGRPAPAAAQSVEFAHGQPAAQAGQPEPRAAPPQSTPVSAPSRTPLRQPGGSGEGEGEGCDGEGEGVGECEGDNDGDAEEVGVGVDVCVELAKHDPPEKPAKPGLHLEAVMAGGALK